MSKIPEIRDLNGIPTLFVNGEPFLAHGGEIHNSSASDLQFMEEKVWPNLRGMNVNTLIVPLYWELIESEEGRYCFDTVDGLIAQARENSTHLVFLWFGLWKNAESMYVPAWMKRDSEKYFRIRKANGEPINTISPLCTAAIEKDAACFKAIMAHIRKVDEEQSTVIMIQVENEIGAMGTGRDYGEAAEAAFRSEVPACIAELYGKGGSWSEVCGEEAAEAFMAWAFGSAVETITAAGRAEYPLPCYANAWLKQYPWFPGSYPMGGPVREMHKVWKAVAPSLFTLAPDIYVPYVPQIMEDFSYPGNPLMIPEVRKDSVTASYALYAFAHHNAICYSPFGLEDLALRPEEIDKPPMEVMIALNIDPSAFDITGSKDYLSRVYQLIDETKPLYLQYRGTNKLHSFLKKNDTDFGAFIQAEKYDICVGYAPKQPSKPLAAGVIYELSPDKFLIIGMQSSISFRVKEGVNAKVDLVSFLEGDVVNGEFKPGRVLNGDEKMAIRLGDRPSCLMVELFQY